jgi:hypothetical protein
MRSALLLPLVFFGLHGQDTDAGSLIPHVQSAAPADARYEIVQSHLAATFTFKLDKYAGRVWELVHDAQGKLNWQVLPVLEGPKITNPAGVRFQIFTSGLAGQFTFLLDMTTGRAWLLTTFKDGNAWAPMAEVD